VKAFEAATGSRAGQSVMEHLRQLALGFFAGYALAGCTATMAAAQAGRPAPPDTKAIVLRYLHSQPVPPAGADLGKGPGNLFADPKKLGLVELSPPSLVQHPMLGWTWVACLRTHPDGQSAHDYALFISGKRIQDARLSVATDHCAARKYEVLGVFGVPLKKPKSSKVRQIRQRH